MAQPIADAGKATAEALDAGRRNDAASDDARRDRPMSDSRASMNSYVDAAMVFTVSNAADGGTWHVAQ